MVAIVHPEVGMIVRSQNPFHYKKFGIGTIVKIDPENEVAEILFSTASYVSKFSYDFCRRNILVVR